MPPTPEIAKKPKSFPIFVSSIKQWRVIQCTLLCAFSGTKCSWKFVDCKPHIRDWRLFFRFLVRRNYVRVFYTTKPFTTRKCSYENIILVIRTVPMRSIVKKIQSHTKRKKETHTHKQLHLNSCSSLALGFCTNSIVIKPLKSFRTKNPH